MNQELFFSVDQWEALRDFSQTLEDAYYRILNSKFEGAEERFSLALKAASYNLDRDLHDPEFFLKIARGIRRLTVTDKVTVYGNGAEDFGVHVLQSVGRMVGEKVSKELSRTGLWRRVSYLYCYRPCGTDFFSQVREGENYPLFTVRFQWQERDMSQAYDCSLNSLLMWLARVPCDVKIAEAVRIFKPFLTSINCVKIDPNNDKTKRGWWGMNIKSGECQPEKGEGSQT